MQVLRHPVDTCHMFKIDLDRIWMNTEFEYILKLTIHGTDIYAKHIYVHRRYIQTDIRGFSMFAILECSLKYVTRKSNSHMQSNSVRGWKVWKFPAYSFTFNYVQFVSEPRLSPCSRSCGQHSLVRI